MALTVDTKFDLKMKPKVPGSTPWEKGLLSLAAFGAIVNIGGLGSFQNILATNDVRPIATKLVGVPLFNTVLGGSEVGQPLFFFDSTDMLRFFWFVTCWNIVMVAMGFASVLAGPQQYPRYRPWLAGLFTVSIMLNIWCGDAWLTAIDVAFSGPLQLDSAKTTVAGYIMSGAIQALLVLVFGWECC